MQSLRPTSPSAGSSRLSFSVDPIQAWEHRRLEYTRFIKACYHAYPDSVTYFTQLVEYISDFGRNGVTRLQAPKVYDVAVNATECEDFEFPFGPARLDDHQTSPRMVVIEGFLSPDCLIEVGQRFYIRPELFIGHLDMNSRSLQSFQHYELPTIPSRRDNIIHLTFVSLVKLDSDNRNRRMLPTSERRRDVESSCAQAKQKLFGEGRYGATRYRNINVHSSKMVSTEQLLSFTVFSDPENSNSWSGIFLLDSGASFMDNHDLPWIGYNKNSRPTGTVPLIPYNAQLTRKAFTEDSRVRSQEQATLDQFHPLKSVFVKDRTDRNLLLEDPFFIFASVATTAAMTWSMLLNTIDEDVRQCENMGTKENDFTMQQLRFNLDLINRVEKFLAEISYITMAGGCRAWPAAKGVDARDRKSALQEALRADQQLIRSRCTALTKRCESVSTILLSTAQLLRAQKGIDQAKQIHALTQLAFFFLPVSFIGTLFGMNVRELESSPTIGYYFAFAAPVFLSCCIFASWERIGSRIEQWQLTHDLPNWTNDWRLKLKKGMAKTFPC